MGPNGGLFFLFVFTNVLQHATGIILAICQEAKAGGRFGTATNTISKSRGPKERRLYEFFVLREVSEGEQYLTNPCGHDRKSGQSNSVRS